MSPDPAGNCLSPRQAFIALLWGFAEATLFFVVPDVILSWIALTRSFRAALFASLLAAAGAAGGGAVIHAWSAADPQNAARVIEALPAIPAGAVAAAEASLQNQGLQAALAGAFRGAPFKVWSAAAPAAGWSAPAWALAAFPVRLPRFLLVAAGFALLGRLLRPHLPPRALMALFAAGWMLFYALFWLLSPW